MNLHCLPSFSKILSILGMAAAAYLTVGCSKVDSGSPTPSPSPSPTVTPSPSPTPTSTSSSSTAQLTTDDVVLTNAKIIEAAAADSVSELSAAEKPLSRTELKSEDLTTARASLANARDAFVLVEASLHYSDPENAAEQSALPPKLLSAQPSLFLPGFDNLDAQLSKRLAGKTSPSNEEILALAASLQADLESLTTAWNPSPPDNFRNDIFLPDPDAPARIFQGAVATTDLLLLASDRPDKQAQVLPRLRALKSLLEGTYENVDGEQTFGRGLLALIAENDPERADKIQNTLKALIFQQSNTGSTQQPVPPLAFENLREDLLIAARILGYKIETRPDPPPAK